jgi:glycosyltransferase 2 family protein
VLPLLAGAAALVWWRGPDWGAVANAFTAVQWQWVVAAVALNLASVVVRSLAWQMVIRHAMGRFTPPFRYIFSAFCVGLLANVVLPGRVGELARVAVLVRRVPGRNGVWATLVGTVFAHRIFDLFPSLALIVYVLVAAKIPHWALTSLILVVAAGFALFGIAFVAARRQHRSVLDEAGPIRRVVGMARVGLTALRAPLPAAKAAVLQGAGWVCQLFAVYTAMRGFNIHAPVAAAGLVLVLMNLASIFPLWPGNLGLVQAAIALPLVQYGVPYAKGFAFGLGLAAIEASVGVTVGLIFLAREGLSIAMLKRMPDAERAVAEMEDELAEPERARARVAG